MNIELHALTKADKPLLDRYLHSRYYENAHFSFTNFFMWREPFHLQVGEQDGVLYLGCADGQKAWFLQPFTSEEKWPEAVANIVAHCRAAGREVHFMGLEKDFADWLAAREDYHFTIAGNRDESDYVYLAEKLATLSGRKLHAKKNHLNAFHKLYPQVEYLPITEELIPACKQELDSWYRLRTATTEQDNPFIAAERRGILEVLDDYAFFGLEGGAIRVDGRIIAFTFGEQLNTDTAVVHVEKADPNMRGAFTAINQAYVANVWQDRVTYINREEDMGLEGLRHAKESYKPVKMIEKFTARLVD